MAANGLGCKRVGFLTKKYRDVRHVLRQSRSAPVRDGTVQEIAPGPKRQAQQERIVTL